MWSQLDIFFLCCGADKRKCCSSEVGKKSWMYLKTRLNELKGENALPGIVLRTQANCFQVCQNRSIAALHMLHRGSSLGRRFPSLLCMHYSSTVLSNTRMNTAEDEIASLKAEIKGYEGDLATATTPAEKIAFANLITACRQKLAALLATTAAPTAPTAGKCLIFHVMVSPNYFLLWLFVYDDTNLIWIGLNWLGEWRRRSVISFIDFIDIFN